MTRAYRLLCAAWVWFCLLAPLGAQADTLRVGSKRFTESYILAQVVAQSAQAAGAQVQVRQVVHAALRQALGVMPSQRRKVRLKLLVSR